MTADCPSSQLEGLGVHVTLGTVVRGLHQIVQDAHMRVQDMNPLAVTFALVEENPTIKPVTRLAGGPLVLHSRR
jgi:hypothetical protein